MELTDLLIDQWFGRVRGELRVGDIPISELAARYGTPLFVYDRALLDLKLDLLRAALPQEFDIYYSMKANPNLAIVSHFVSRGCGLEVASASEFMLATSAGCPADRIVFAGPGKTDAELDIVVRQGIGEIHMESANEAARIAAICQRDGASIRVAVRVNPAVSAAGGAMRMGGKAAPFGVDEEDVLPLIDYLLSTSCFEFRGIHMFAGTQILDYSVLAAQYRRGVEVARAVVSMTGSPLATLDLGGGLGIPYFAGDKPLDLDRLAAEVSSLMSEVRNDSRFGGTRFLLEPGRYLVGEAGIYVGRIVDIKKSRGKKFVILDGGMNHHLAASGNLGQTIKRNYPLVMLERLDQPVDEEVDIVGPLCTPLDTLGRGLRVPKPAVGDLVGILQSGAYARAASPLGFLSHPSPAEVWVEGKASHLIRTRGRPDDAMRDVRLPESLTGSSEATAHSAAVAANDGVT